MGIKVAIGAILIIWFSILVAFIGMLPFITIVLLMERFF